MSIKVLSAVTVCVNYADFLEHIIEHNKKVIDRWIIVTDLKDHKTKELCDLHGLECVQTDVFYMNAKFNKYAGINEGLKLVHKDSWCLFLDGDIVLHRSTRRVLNQLNLQKDCIYGMDRLNCAGVKRWKQYQSSRGVLNENWMLTSAGLPIGSRLVHHYGHEGEGGRFEGYRPLGFFQLCHKNHFETYPDNSKGADHCDLVFARQWPRHKRHLIPELFVIHLESDVHLTAANWYGRRTAKFEEIIEEKIHIKETIITPKGITQVEIDFEIEEKIKIDLGCPPCPKY